MSDPTVVGAAPWTADEVRWLRDRQANRSLHAYTCAEHSSAALVPTARGWVCRVPTCGYRQNWAHPVDLGRTDPPLLAAVPDDEPFGRYHYVTTDAGGDEIIADRRLPGGGPVSLLEQARASLAERTFEIRIIVPPEYKWPRERITAGAFDLFESLLSDVGSAGTEVRLTGPNMAPTTWTDA